MAIFLLRKREDYLLKWSFALPILCALTATPGIAAAQELRISTWNLNNLAGQNNSGCVERVQSDYDEIKKIINAVDADIWLFQEVESIGALARVMDPGKWDFHLESRPDWSSMPPCLGNGRNAVMQRVAIATKKGLAIGKKEELSFLDTSGRGTLRYGVAVNIAHRGRTIHILNVHLKAGCSEGIKGSNCNTLFEQIPYLASYINEISESNVPIVVGGDFNRTIAERGDPVWQSLSYKKATGLEIASNTSRSKCSLRGHKNIDYILTNTHQRDLMSVEDDYEHSFNGPFESWPSDHCPIVVTFTPK